MQINHTTGDEPRLHPVRKLDHITWVIKFKYSGEYLKSVHLYSGGFWYCSDYERPRDLRTAHRFDTAADARDVARSIGRSCKVMRVRGKPLLY